MGGNEEHIGPGDLYPDWMRNDRESLWNNAMNLQTPQYYGGQLIADQNPALQGSLAGMYNYGQPGGMGYDAAQQMYGAGSAGLGAMQGGMDYLQGMNQRGPNTFQYDQGLYDQTMANQMGGYQGMFDHGAQQIQQGFDFNQLPGLQMQNAMTGGGGNTKFGQAGTLGQAMANQNIAGFGADLWGQANQMANQNAFGAGSQNLGSANAFDNSMLNQYGQYAQLGGNQMGQAYDMGTGNLGLGLRAGQYDQDYAQSLIDAQMKKHNFEQQAPWIDQNQRLAMMKQFEMGAMPQTQGASAWETGLQGLQSGLGVYDMGKEQGWWGTTA
jgi:hypothetical protein